MGGPIVGTYFPVPRMDFDGPIKPQLDSWRLGVLVSMLTEIPPFAHQETAHLLHPRLASIGKDRHTIR